MDLYLAGHGYIARTVPACTIPNGFSIVFYCKKQTEFDSTWEASVTSGAAASPAFKPAQGMGQWQVSTVGAGETCVNHLLTRPGGMKTQKSLKDMKEIRTDVAAGAMISSGLADQDTLCIKSGGKLMTGGFGDGLTYTYLSDILISLQKAVPGGATVHWLACRSADTNRRDIEAQAQGSWMGLQL